MFTSLYQIAKNTFRESLREPIFLLILLSALVLIGLYPILTLFVFFAQEKLVVDSSIATMMVFGWGLAIMLASNSLSREIDNGMALLLLSRPVQPPVFIIAKILGGMAALPGFRLLAGDGLLLQLLFREASGAFFNLQCYRSFLTACPVSGTAAVPVPPAGRSDRPDRSTPARSGPSFCR